MLWDKHILGILWAYSITPHQSTGEKPSYLLFGFDFRSPTEASLLPTSPDSEVDITNYRRELTLKQENLQQCLYKELRQNTRNSMTSLQHQQHLQWEM